MKRVISLYLPRWPTDRARKQLGMRAPSRETPFALSWREGQRLIVMHADRAAQDQGIQRGMTISQARAIAMDMRIEAADPAADRNALISLAFWALRRYSPLIATDTDGLWIDATGCTHLFGGEQAMLDDLLGKLEASGAEAKAVMAPTYGAAHAIARKMDKKTRIVADRECQALLRPLPVAALRLSSGTAAGLSKLGLDTIGELGETPREVVAMRFGAEPLLRLDQALGSAAEVMQPVRPEEPVTERRVFAEPIAAPETIARYIGILTDALCRKLEMKSSGARCLDLFCHRIDGELKVLRIGLAEPRRDAARLARLLCDKLETLDPGYGIEIMRLSASWVEPLAMKQIDLEPAPRTMAGLTGLIDSLSNRIGAEHIYQIMPVESDVPERSFIKVAPLTATATPHAMVSWPRPVRLFLRPEPIDTIGMLPDYAPVSFTWRGRRHKICLADGPERIYGEWWKRDAEMEAARDYFHLEDETGARFWVFRSGDGKLPGSGSGKWFIHGIF